MKIGKKAFILCSILLVPTLLIGCNNTTTNNSNSNSNSSVGQTVNDNSVESKNINKLDDNKIGFSLFEGVTIDQLTDYDGFDVEFHGYMSLDHPDGDMAIITFNPEGLCVFHSDIELEKEVSMPVKLKEGEILEYVYSPVKVNGKLKVGDTTDNLNHSFKYIIEDATISKVESDKATGILKDYIELADKGVFEALRKEHVAIDEALGYKVFNKDIDSLQRVDIESLKTIKTTIESTDTDNYEVLLESLDSAISIGGKVNEALDKKDLKLLEDHSLIIDVQNMFQSYQYWQLKYSI